MRDGVLLLMWLECRGTGMEARTKWPDVDGEVIIVICYVIFKFISGTPSLTIFSGYSY